jgi:hypothetical protein
MIVMDYFIGYMLFNDDFNSYTIMSNGWMAMNDDLERIGKKAIVA